MAKKVDDKSVTTTKRATGKPAATATTAAHSRRGGHTGQTNGSTPGGGTTATGQIMGWEDDPLSGVQPIGRPAVDLSKTPLPLHITANGPVPAEKIYSVGTAGFRYWAAADALRRASDFWGTIVPKNLQWQLGARLEVWLDRGVDLNAYYSRGDEAGNFAGLSFFHDTVAGQTVYSGESPDVVCHELGHAVLDALRPQLFNTMSDEVAAFHESFGDMSAILTALQLPSIRQVALVETGGRLYRSSRLSRLAEQLGWAIRQIQADAVESDCLRNAVNSFFYQNPTSLPPRGPSSILSSEPHSFSRVFTAAFFDALAGMLTIESKGNTPTEEQLQHVSVSMASLLVQGVVASPITPDYYSQVAAHIVEADHTLNNDTYRDALKGAFVRHGVLSLEAADSLTPQAMADAPRAVNMGIVATGGGNLAMARAADLDTDQPPKVSITVRGLGNRSIMCYSAGQPKRFGVTAAVVGLDVPPAHNESQAATTFTENLVRRGHVDVGNFDRGQHVVDHPFARKTHALVEEEGAVTIIRRLFDCGFGHSH